MYFGVFRFELKGNNEPLLEVLSAVETLFDLLIFVVSGSLTFPNLFIQPKKSLIFRIPHNSLPFLYNFVELVNTRTS